MKTLLSAAAVAALICFSTGASAIDSPKITKDRLEVEYSGYRLGDDGKYNNNKQKHSFAVGYGITDYWKVDAYLLQLERAHEKDLDYQTTKIENIFSFWPTGEQWVDAGMMITYEFAAKHTAADALGFVLLLEKDYDQFTTMANIGLEREVGGHSKAGNHISFVANTRYRYSKSIQPGIEWDGEFGRFSDQRDFHEQSHYVGPIMYGNILPFLKYEAGLFAGVTDSSADTMARFKIEYQIVLD